MKSSVAVLCMLCVTLLIQAQNLAPDSTPGTQLHRMFKMDQIKLEDWKSRWEKEIIVEMPKRYCDSVSGEEIAWLLRPFLLGYYYGFLATQNSRWIDLQIGCADAWIARAMQEPDGYVGWPKIGAAGTDVDHLDDYFADSMLGEGMGLHPLLLMAKEILRSPALSARYAAKASSYVKLSEQIFDKWSNRGAWRNSSVEGMISVELPFGIDQSKGTWTSGYEKRWDSRTGFSHPDNKANLVACWLLALFDATQDTAYRDQAEKWFQLMKSRMKLKGDGTYYIWNYWEPAGPWDYDWVGIPKHWIGVHPNSGYYDIDLEGIMTAYQHGIVFGADTVNHLIGTALAEKRYWTALVPYDTAIQRKFEETLDPSSWDGLVNVPRYLALQSKNSLAQ